MRKKISLALVFVMIFTIMAPVTAVSSSSMYNGSIMASGCVCDPCDCIEWEWVQVWAAGAYDYEKNYHKLYLMQREYGARRPYNVDRLWARSNPSNSFGPPSAPNNVAFGDDEFTGIGLFVDGITYKFGHGPSDYRHIYRHPDSNVPDLTITEVTWNWRWHFEAVRVYLLNVELYDGSIVDEYFLGEVYNKVYDERNPDNPRGGYIQDGFYYLFRVDGNFIHADLFFPEHIFRAESLRLEDFTDELHNLSTARNGCPIENTGPNPHRTYTRYCDGFDVDAMSTWYRRPVERWEWVQVWAAGAYDYQSNYLKLYLMNREYGARRPYNVDRLWARSNPSNAFGPPSAPNNVAFGDDEFTGIGLFIDGITYRFGHGPNDYRYIYRQPNRDIPDLTITEVTWNMGWHYEAVRVYLINAELTDGTVEPKYFLGEVFNKVYDERNPDNPKGGYIQDGFYYMFTVDGNFIHTELWFPEHIFRAESLRLVDITDELHNWSTARNGCPIANTGPNPHRTYTRYCDGFDVDAMSTWYRRLVSACNC